MTPDDFRTNFVGAAFDGQYFILKVPEELTAIGQLSPNWSTFIWDPAHRIELAENDMRKTCRWVQDMQQIIGDINKATGFGKNFEEMLDLAEQEEKNYCMPLRFSTTRFATYSTRVLRNFSEN